MGVGARMPGQRRRRVIAVAVVALLALVLLAFGGDVAAAVKALLTRIRELPGPLLVTAVGVLALLETAAFAGLAVPGELAVVLGGVAAAEGRAPVAVMAASAVVGAILGDSLGFLFGRKLGTRVLDGRLGALMGRSRVESTMARIRSGGIRFVILGRFIGVLRAVMPFAAGASGMRYGRFFVASAIGSVAWGTGFTLLGAAAGESWDTVEKYAGRASTVLGVFIGMLVLLVLVARKVSERQEAIRSRWQAFLSRPRVAAIRRRYRRELGFLVGRFRPGPAAGLQLTASLIGLALLGYALSYVVTQLAGPTGLFAVDEPLREVLADSRTADAVAGAQTAVSLTGPLAAAVVAAAAGMVAWVVDRRPRALVLLAGAVGGAAALGDGVQALIKQSRFIPSLVGPASTSFPSTQMTMVGAVVVGLLVVMLPRLHRWTWSVAAVTLAIAIVLLAGFARVYLAEVYLSDALGGSLLGALWGLAVATAVTTAWRPPDRRTRSGETALVASGMRTTPPAE